MRARVVSDVSRRPRLLAQLRQAIRVRHYSRHTEEAYVGWVRRFVRFCGMRHPAELGEAEVARFLTSLAEEAGVGATTQNQAASALQFLYEHLLQRPFARPAGIVRAKEPGRLPVVLTPAEVRLVLGQLRGVPRLVASLLYGSGLRLLEALALLDFLFPILGAAVLTMFVAAFALGWTSR